MALYQERLKTTDAMLWDGTNLDALEAWAGAGVLTYNPDTQVVSWDYYGSPMGTQPGYYLTRDPNSTQLGLAVEQSEFEANWQAM